MSCALSRGGGTGSGTQCERPPADAAADAACEAVHRIWSRDRLRGSERVLGAWPIPLLEPVAYVLETPGYGCVIQIDNLGPMEYPLTASVVPHSIDRPGRAPRL